MLLANAALLLGLMLVCGAASAFFSAAETALFSLQPRQIGTPARDAARRGARLDALFANPRRLLSMILLADMLDQPAAVRAGPVLPARLFVLAHGRGRPARVPVWPTALVLFVLVVGVCDLLPKLFALRRPERVARPAVRVLGWLRPVLSPACGGLQAASEWLADRLTPPRVRHPAQVDGGGVRRAGGSGRGGGRDPCRRERDDPGNHQAGRQDGQGLHDAARGGLRHRGRPAQRRSHRPAARRTPPPRARLRRDARRHRRRARRAAFPRTGRPRDRDRRTCRITRKRWTRPRSCRKPCARSTCCARSSRAGRAWR